MKRQASSHDGVVILLVVGCALVLLFQALYVYPRIVVLQQQQQTAWYHQQYKSGNAARMPFGSTNSDSQLIKSTTTATRTHLLELPVTKKKQIHKRQPMILIVVTTSRKNFASRIGAIADSWAKNLPTHVVVRYFVGQDDSNTNTTMLAQSANLQDATHIVELQGVVDDEYPPIFKNVAMLQQAHHICKHSFHYSQKINWIFKVDDDTHVNIDQLTNLVGQYSSREWYYLGRQAWGQPHHVELRQAGLQLPYCMGGPGYITSRSLLRRITPKLKKCVQQYSFQNTLTWHSDILIGMCIQKVTDVGCTSTSPTLPFDLTFFQIPTSIFEPQDLLRDEQHLFGYTLNSVSVHAVKNANIMRAYHDKLMNAKRENKQDE